jgi:radical SAM modification target selenobiotic family peptide
MDQKELKRVLAGVSLAALIAGAATVGCAHADKASEVGGQKTQGGAASSCGGASGCGGKGGCGGSKK